MSLTLLGAGKGVLGGAAGPTVILNLNWLTDTGILNMVGAPIENGFYVGTWPFATGGTATSALAIAAGADTGPLYDLTNGIENDGTGPNAALTLPSPVTIPADVDCVIYVVTNYAGGSFFVPFGKTGANDLLEFDNEVGVVIAGAAGTAQFDGYPTTGAKTLRIRRVSNVWKRAWTGEAEANAVSDGLAGAAVTFDTLLAHIGSGNYSATGNYLQKAYIFHGSSTPDTAYEIANGGAL